MPAEPTARFPIGARSLLDHRRAITAWAVGIAVYVGVVIAAWPSIHHSTAMAAAVQQYPDAVKELFGGPGGFDMSTGAGYLNVEFFSLMAPVLLLVFAIGLGASTLAGEESSGHLDLELGLPVTRRRLVLEKFSALIIAITALGMVMATVITIAGAFTDLQSGVRGIVAATTGALLLAALHGTMALAVGAATGSRALAIGTATGTFVAGYLAQALAGLITSLKPVRMLSTMYHANGSTPIRNGFPFDHFALLVVVTGVLAAAAVGGFERRDIRS